MNKYQIHKEKLKVLMKAIYGVSTVDYYARDSESFIIKLGIGAGLISKFKLETGKQEKTDHYLERFKILFFHSFNDRALEFEYDSEKKQMNQDIIIKNALVYFVGMDAIDAVLKTCVEDQTSSRRRFVPTTESIFDVMEHYDTYQGIPMICTEDQLTACKEKYGDQYDSAMESETDVSSVNVKSLTFDEFCRKYPDTLEAFGKSIYTILVDIMLPVFSKPDPSKEELENDYNSAYERIKADITKIFESEARKRLFTNEANDVKKIILIDKDCEIKNLKKTLLYYPDCAPVLSSWQIPVHHYKKYQMPSYTKDEIMDVLIHPARLNTSCFPLDDLQVDENMVYCPVSKIQIPYSQNMFYDFQIQYMTSENRLQSNSPFFLYNVDSIISGEIKARWSGEIQEHWKCVFNSIGDILQRIFSINFMNLIKEPLLEKDGDIYDKYLDVFLQEDALVLAENTYSEFLQKGMIQRHYFFQQIKSPGYADLFGANYISQLSMKQVAFILIPLIGKFVSELNNTMYDIAGVVGDIVTKSEFDNHVNQINQYLEEEKLDSAIKAWDEAYNRRKKYELKEKRRLASGGVTVNPDDRLLGLMSYAEGKGNLFQNLKNVLEEYRYCLQELC